MSDHWYDLHVQERPQHGRVVSTDALETSIAGVLVKFLGKDDNGATTGCTGQTNSDAAGNFAITGLAAACTGRQLIRFDGTTATAPPGAYGGVDLIFTLFGGAVTSSPVLVHLPRIDNAEVFNITQNSASDQTFTSTTVPGIKFTVYAGSVLTRSDGSQPNPYPMTLVKIPLDRLPDAKPPVPNMSMSFLVSFGPVGTNASKQVAVTYPNYALSPPGTQMTLMTLDPTKGQMVPYGTGTVTADVGQIEPDLDSANPGQRFGIRNFDWHGPMPPPAPISPCPEGPG